MAAPAFNPSRQRLTDCPMCSTVLCAHGVCRVCSDCYACDEIEAAIASGDSLQTQSVNRAERDRLARLAAERRQLISEIREVLAAERCQCDRLKAPDQLFCRMCSRKLTPELRVGLFRAINTGLLPVYQRAKQHLGI
jgi:hypothetical protein